MASLVELVGLQELPQVDPDPFPVCEGGGRASSAEVGLRVEWRDEFFLATFVPVREMDSIRGGSLRKCRLCDGTTGVPVGSLRYPLGLLD